MATRVTDATRQPPEALTSRKSSKAPDAPSQAFRGMHLRALFAENPKRGEQMPASGADIFLDYSKNRITEETVPLLLQLAEESGLRQRIDAMFRGEKINVPE